MSVADRLRNDVRLAIIGKFRGTALRTVLYNHNRHMLSFDYTFDDNAVGEVTVSATKHFLFRVTISQYRGIGAPIRTIFFQPKELGLIQNRSTNLRAHTREGYTIF